MASWTTAGATAVRSLLRTIGAGIGNTSRRDERVLGSVRSHSVPHPDNFLPLLNDGSPPPQRSGWLLCRNHEATIEKRLRDDPTRRAWTLNRDLNSFPGLASHVDWLASPTMATERPLSVIAKAHAIADFYSDVMSWCQVSGYSKEEWAQHVRQLAPDVVRLKHWVNGSGGAAAATATGGVGAYTAWMSSVRLGAAAKPAAAADAGTTAASLGLSALGGKIVLQRATTIGGAVKTAADSPAYLSTYRATYEMLLENLAWIGHPERGLPETEPLKAALTRPEFADRLMHKLSESPASAVFCGDPALYGLGEGRGNRFMPGLPAIESYLAGALFEAQAELLSLRAEEHSAPGRSQLILRYWVYFAARHRAAYPDERSAAANPAAMDAVRSVIASCLRGPDGGRPSEAVQRSVVAMMADPRVGKQERDMLETACVEWAGSLARDMANRPPEAPPCVPDAMVGTSVGIAWIAQQHARRAPGADAAVATPDDVGLLIDHLAPRIGASVAGREVEAAVRRAFSRTMHAESRQPSPLELEAVERAVDGPQMPHWPRTPLTSVFPERPAYRIKLAQGQTGQDTAILGLKVSFKPGVLRFSGKDDRREIFGIGSVPPVKGRTGHLHTPALDDQVDAGNAIVAATALAASEQLTQLVRPDRVTLGRLLEERAQRLKASDQFDEIADASRAVTLANMVRVTMGTETAAFARPSAPFESVGASLQGAWHLLPESSSPSTPAARRAPTRAAAPRITWPNVWSRPLHLKPIGANNSWRPDGLKVCVRPSQASGVLTANDGYAAYARDAARRDMLADPVNAFSEQRLREDADLGATYGWTAARVAGFGASVANGAAWVTATAQFGGGTGLAATQAATAAGVGISGAKMVYDERDSSRVAYVKAYLEEKHQIFEALQQKLNGPMEPHITTAGEGRFNGRSEASLRRDLIERATRQGPSDSRTWLDQVVWDRANAEETGAVETHQDLMTVWGHLGERVWGDESAQWRSWKRAIGVVAIETPTPLPSVPIRPQ